MTALTLGATGPEVIDLRNQLAKRGFPTGVPLPVFDSATDIAVRAFQRSCGLTPDGWAGNMTRSALFGLPTPAGIDYTKLVTATMVHRMFPATPCANIAANLPAVLAALSEAGVTERAAVIMAIATIRAEIESFKPVKEGVSKYNTSPGGAPFNLYDNRRDLGNTGAPDGSLYAGRGYVQLTGRANYQTHGKNIGMGDQLVKKPDLAIDPVIAAKLLASFIKSVKTKSLAALADGNLAAARRLVNGGSHGLDRFSSAYTIGDQLVPR